MSTSSLRILIAIDPEGNWVATGSSAATHPDEPKEWLLTDTLTDGWVYCWVTAEVPVPLETSLSGVVENV